MTPDARLRLVTTVYSATVRMLQSGRNAGEITFYIETPFESEAAEISLIKFRELVAAPDEWLETSVGRIAVADIPKDAEIIRAESVEKSRPRPITGTGELRGMERHDHRPWLGRGASQAPRKAAR